MGRLARAYGALRNHPAYVPGIDELVDFTKTSVKDLSQSEIELIREYMVAAPEQHGCKSAIIVNTKVEYGLTRMMGLTLDTDVPADRFVCYSVREALEWLRPGRADELMAAYEDERRRDWSGEG
jgi:hypothetical protein